MRPEQTHRVEWQHVRVRDPRSGEERLAYVWPRYVPREVSTWRERLLEGPVGLFDLTIAAAALACLVAAVVTR